MTQAPEDYLAIKQAVREQADDVVLNFTTAASSGTARRATAFAAGAAGAGVAELRQHQLRTRRRRLQ